MRASRYRCLLVWSVALTATIAGLWTAAKHYSRQRDQRYRVEVAGHWKRTARWNGQNHTMTLNPDGTMHFGRGEADRWRIGDGAIFFDSSTSNQFTWSVKAVNGDRLVFGMEPTTLGEALRLALKSGLIDAFQILHARNTVSWQYVRVSEER